MVQIDMSKGKSNKDIKRTGSALFAIALAAIILTLAIAAGIYLESNTYIQSVQVEGTYFIESEDILGSITSPVGIRADSVNFDTMFTQIKSLPYVKDATVSMSMRGILKFQIQEHKPIAMLINGTSRSYIAPGAVELPLISGKVVNVPLVYGISLSKNSDKPLAREVKLMDDFLTALSSNDIGWATISEVAWDSREGIVALTTENGVKLIFGEEDYSQKLQDWQAFYTDIVTQKGLQSFDIIDLRFRDQIVTRKL